MSLQFQMVPEPQFGSNSVGPISPMYYSTANLDTFMYGIVPQIINVPAQPANAPFDETIWTDNGGYSEIYGIYIGKIDNWPTTWQFPNQQPRIKFRVGGVDILTVLIDLKGTAKCTIYGMFPILLPHPSGAPLPTPTERFINPQRIKNCTVGIRVPVLSITGYSFTVRIVGSTYNP